MKRMLIVGSILVLFCLTGCTKTENNSGESVPVESVDPVAYQSVELKKYRFQSAEEVEKMSDEDLVYINQHAYRTSDFYEEGEFKEVDFFGVELDEELYEGVSIDFFWRRDLEIELDVSQPIPEEEFDRLVEEDIEMMYYYADSRREDEETGDKVVSKDTFFCGENDMYAAYSVRYTQRRTMYVDHVLTSNDIPRAYRQIYLKNFLMETNVEDWRAYLLGDLSADYVKEQLDVFAYNFPATVSRSHHVPIIYREVIEEEDRYIYITYNSRFDYSESGENNVVILEKIKNYVDKETHVMTCDYPVEVRRAEIPGTEYDVEPVY